MYESDGSTALFNMPSVLDSSHRVNSVVVCRVYVNLTVVYLCGVYYYDKEKLVADVLKAAAEYPTEQLGRMWEYKE